MINLNQGREYKQLNKGITLVALVVTIVVLLILAGISINLLLGENGIIKKSERSERKNSRGQNKWYAWNEPTYTRYVWLRKFREQKREW